MTDWAGKGKAAVSPRLSDGEKGRSLLAVVNERLDAEGGRGLAWGAMRYGCDLGCGFEQWYELEVGVEGPPAWKEDGTTVACAFVAGRCLRCAGSMKHIDFVGDITFKKSVAFHTPFLTGRGIVTTQAAKVFRVPREPVRWPTHLVASGEVRYDQTSHAFLMANVKGARDPRF